MHVTFAKGALAERGQGAQVIRIYGEDTIPVLGRLFIAARSRRAEGCRFESFYLRCRCVLSILHLFHSHASLPQFFRW